jgi:hypothetical protein
MSRLRSLLVMTVAGSLLVAIRKRRRSPGAVVGDIKHRASEAAPAAVRRLRGR